MLRFVSGKSQLRRPAQRYFQTENYYLKLYMAQRSHRSHSSRTHSSAPRTSTKVESNAPLHTLTEDEVVRKIHKKVGGPSKLSTYDDPAKVRAVVIQALAQEQTTAADAHRVQKGDLTTFERRVVRTVTNRGAAVRSRMRQRKELQRLRDELRAKDQHVRALEQRVEQLTRGRDASSAQHLPPDAMQYTMMGDGQVMPHVMTNGEPSYVTMHNSMTASSSASSSTHDDRQWTPSSVDREQFGKWIDQMIS